MNICRKESATLSTHPSTLIQLPIWQALEQHYLQIRNVHLRSLFKDDAYRGQRFALEATGIYLDYSKNLMTDETLRLLLQLATDTGLHERIDAMFRGQRINSTEQLPALHTALRAPSGDPLMLDDQDIVANVHATLNKIEDFSNQVRNGIWRGYTGQRIRNIVNIGIGGSDLAPRAAYEALKYYSDRGLRIRFVSNIDGSELTEALHDLDAAETLFIIVSKTFSTLETITNALAARRWCIQALGDERAVEKHFVAVSANAEEVARFGIDLTNRFEVWDWVTGRYAAASAISLSLAIAIGSTNFRQMLVGFRAMDEHFRTAPFKCNLPVLLALIGIWYNNFFAAETLAILPYSSYLGHLITYFQQLDMESNGKRVDQNGQIVNYHTGPIVWGLTGTDCLHSFYQLINQGTKLIPCDFIGFCQPLSPLEEHHELLMANFLAQTHGLAFGQKEEEAAADGVASRLQPHRASQGNHPTNTILMKRLTPETLGKLIALYEHKVFVQGIIWNINSFDQWGVEQSKTLARSIVTEIRRSEESSLEYDSSTNTLIRHIMGAKNWTDL